MERESKRGKAVIAKGETERTRTWKREGVWEREVGFRGQNRKERHDRFTKATVRASGGVGVCEG
jgi:hypothetical protein